VSERNCPAVKRPGDPSSSLGRGAEVTKTMSRVQRKGGGLTDYVLELDESEMQALRAAVEDADGRLSEVREAKRILGVR